MAFGDIVLLRDRTPRGPFTRTQIQEGLGRGEFNARDLAHTPGLKDWLPLIEVLHHLDREVVHWPRSREGRMLPPVPGAPPLSAAEESLVMPESEAPPAAPLLPPPIQLERVTENVSAKDISRPPDLPVVPLAEKPGLPLAQARPPALDRSPALEPAPFMTRAFAFAIDWAVLFLPILAVFGFSYLIGSIRGSIEHRDPETARQEQALLWRNLRDLMLLVANGFAWIYAAGLESSRWQGTIGKQAMGLMVTDGAGVRLSFLRATGRHAAKYLSALPLFLGFMAALFGPERLAWHDRLAGTRVTKKRNPLPFR